MFHFIAITLMNLSTIESHATTHAAAISAPKNSQPAELRLCYIKHPFLLHALIDSDKTFSEQESSEIHQNNLKQEILKNPKEVKDCTEKIMAKNNQEAFDPQSDQFIEQRLRGILKVIR